jgi:NADPH-dependent 2,4-dienoyl-CoA reductase/sulfur reductase-like enzyme
VTSFPYLILGGGMVAGYAARTFVEEGAKAGELGIVSSDQDLPYERPPLSKGFLAGRDTDEGILINPPGFYRRHGIEVALGQVVERVDFGSKRLRTRSGEEYAYEKLLIATGARPRTLHLPGNVYYLRSAADSRRIRDAAARARSAVVIGGGFIGMEVASVLAQKGLPVTMLVAEDRIWHRLFTPGLSSFFQRYYEARGVKVITGVGPVGPPHVSGADLVVAGAGVVPETTLFEGAQLALDNGVLVNEYLETSVPGVWAAGDVANYRDVLYGRRRRVEHWDNAVKQGSHAIRNMMGAREPFRNVPYFFSDVFDLSWEFWGDTSDFDRAETRGDYDSRSVSVWWWKGARLVAAFLMNRPEEERERAQALSAG